MHAFAALPLFVFLAAAVGQDAAPYVPSREAWQRRTPAEAGIDAEKLAAAIAFARANPTDWPFDFSTQERTFGKLLGPMPERRGDTNGVIVRRGYVVATFGDVERIDPTYSVAKSLPTTLTAGPVRDERIGDLDEPVGKRVHDGGYDSEPNALVTWRHHLQQESEWQGEMWGKKHDFVGRVEYGQGERKPRERKTPGSFYEYNDVRINRFALSMLRVFGQPVPDVLRAEVMGPIGASSTWQWVPYRESHVEHEGVRMASVSGGTRWGGGVWISSLDLARFGLLWQRGGVWDRRILPANFVEQALTPSANGPDYGFLWWLNSRQQNWPGLPANCFGARGAGSNTVFVSPDHDLVIVWRWHGTRGNADAKFFGMVIEAVVR